MVASKWEGAFDPRLVSGDVRVATESDLVFSKWEAMLLGQERGRLISVVGVTSLRLSGVPLP